MEQYEISKSNQISGNQKTDEDLLMSFHLSGIASTVRFCACQCMLMHVNLYVPLPYGKVAQQENTCK